MIYSKEYVKQQFPYATCIELESSSTPTFSIDNEKAFLAFMNIAKPSIIFVMERFINAEMCKIDTTFKYRHALNPNLFEDKDYLNFILPMCQSHNEALQNSILHNIPANVAVFVLYEGCSIGFIYHNNINPQNIVLTPREALLNIINSTEDEYAKIKIAKHQDELTKMKKQEEMLSNFIVSDERFARCTSKPKRKQYIRQLLQSELGEEYALLKSHWILANRGISSNVDWFIEELWIQREAIKNLS